MWDKIKSIKFVAWIVLLALSGTMVWFGKGDSGDWIALIKWVTITFLSANVGAHAVHAFARNKEGDNG